VAEKNAGTVTVQAENGRESKASLNGINAHCAGELEVIAASTAAEQACLIKLKVYKNVNDKNIIHLPEMTHFTLCFN
jgi:hypothetical protein